MSLTGVVSLAVGGYLFYTALKNTSKDIAEKTLKVAKPDFDKLYLKYGIKYDIDPELIKAHAIVESGENPVAIGPTNDYGLMQIVYPQKLPAVTNWNQASKEKLLSDPDYNVDVATQIMKWNHSQYSFKKAIAVYNMWAARKAPDNGPFPNQKYVDNVLNAYSSLIGTNYFPNTTEKYW